MKKRILPFLLLTLVVSLSYASSYTFKVTVDDSVQVCYIAGGFNDWSPSATMLTKVSDSPKVFSVDIEIADADTAGLTYKYLSGPDWKYQQVEGDFKLSELTEAGDVVSAFSAYYSPGQEADVTIAVLVPNDVFVCYLTGSFNGWNSTSDEMTLVSSSANGKEFQLQIHSMDTTTLEYKFLAGPGWPYEQTNATNYSYLTDGGTVVCDDFKAIFDPSKVGDITINVTVPDSTLEVWVVGSYNGWDMGTSIQATKNEDGTYTAVIPQVADIEYKIWCHNDWAYEEAADADGGGLPSNRTASFETGPEFNITVAFWKKIYTAPVLNSSFVRTAATVYPENTPIEVNYKSFDFSATDWIGIYNDDDKVPGADNPSIDWAYVPSDSGAVTFTTELAPGNYVVYLLCCDGYDVKAKYNFKIGDATSAFLMASSLSYLSGDSLVFDYSQPGFSATDWIGIYKAGDEPGSTTSTLWAYIPATAGTVVFTDELPVGEYWAGLFCCDGYDLLAKTTFFVTGTPVSADDFKSEKNNFSVYPNPSNGQITINGGNNVLKQVQVYSIAGKLMHSEIINQAGPKTINLSGLNAGIYFLKASSENESFNTKIIIF